MLCPPCQTESDKWLNYRITTTPTLVQIGTPTVRRLREQQTQRYRRWRDTIRSQQQLIADNCHTHHQPTNPTTR